MGFVTTTTASGFGSISLGGTQNVIEVATKVLTMADLAYVRGSSPVRRVYKQAWIGIGFNTTIDGVATFVLNWDHWVRFEAEDIQAGGGAIFAVGDTLYYDVETGGVMYLEADW